ncbi:predicted protein [Postia placenta Mad-698-R]|nr:predicted protein [Postia placenta Mad-698-R]
MPDLDDTQAEIAIAPLMPYSDSTHLTNCGSASLWPIYLYFGSLSKYVGSKPTSFSAHHLAYLPTDAYEQAYGTAATADVLRFCKRELFQAIWLLLLDPEFMSAYEHGIFMKCGDGIMRRLFPRFLTYSADYPEKVLVACTRYLAECPCPQCLVRKADISWLGTYKDAKTRSCPREDDATVHALMKHARNWVFKHGIPLGSKKIANLLDERSLVPTRSAFSTRLSKFGFNVYAMLVPDLMHEHELGVWKAVLTHLLRILYAQGQGRIQELNRRNVSGLKKLAARDYEDILQVHPSPHNELILDLLWDLATWHALAKLRLHTEETLLALEVTTVSVGQQLRKFVAETCESYIMTELPQEEAARGRRTAALKKSQENVSSQSKGKSRAPHTAGNVATTGRSTQRKIQKFNLSTSKLHSLGDIASAIQQYGTSIKSQGESGVRYCYDESVSNQAKHTGTIARESVKTRIATAKSELLEAEASSLCGAAAIPFSTPDPLLSCTSPDDRYHILRDTPHSETIQQWLKAHAGDRAFENFTPLLKDHLLSRLMGRPYDGDENSFSPEEHDTVRFERDQIYFHKYYGPRLRGR